MESSQSGFNWFLLKWTTEDTHIHVILKHLQQEGASCWRSKQGLVQVETLVDQFEPKVEQWHEANIAIGAGRDEEGSCT